MLTYEKEINIWGIFKRGTHMTDNIMSKGAHLMGAVGALAPTVFLPRPEIIHICIPLFLPRPEVIYIVYTCTHTI